MTQPSPSMVARQIPGGDLRQVQDHMVHELLRASGATFQSFMQEAGLGDKDIQACTYEEKVSNALIFCSKQAKES